jgi:hypothetical protein
MRFSVSGLSDAESINSIVLSPYVSTFNTMATATVRVGRYHGNTQTNPDTDTYASAYGWASLSSSSDRYIDNSIEFRSNGRKNLTLGTNANSDLLSLLASYSIVTYILEMAELNYNHYFLIGAHSNDDGHEPEATFDYEVASGIDFTGIVINTAQTSEGEASLSLDVDGASSSASQTSDGNALVGLEASGALLNAAQSSDGLAQIGFASEGGTETTNQQAEAEAQIGLTVSGASIASEQEVSGNAEIALSAQGESEANPQQASGDFEITLASSGASEARPQEIEGAFGLLLEIAGSILNSSQQVSGVFTNGNFREISGTVLNSNQTVQGSFSVKYDFFGNSEAANQTGEGEAKQKLDFSGNSQSQSQNADAISLISFSFSGNSNSSQQASDGNLQKAHSIQGIILNTAQNLQASQKIKFTLQGQLLNQSQSVSGDFENVSDNIRNFVGSIIASSQQASGVFALRFNLQGSVLNDSQVSNGDIQNGDIIEAPEFLNYEQAVDEIFARFNSEWLENAESVLTYIPEIIWNGINRNEKLLTNLFWVKVWQETVTENQATFTNQNSKKRFEVSGLVFVQILCPRQITNSVELGRRLAMIAKDAFRGHSTSGKVWFRNAQVKEIAPDEKFHRFNVIAEYNYDELK